LIEWRATNGLKPPFARVADVVFVKGRLNRAEMTRRPWLPGRALNDALETSAHRLQTFEKIFQHRHVHRYLGREIRLRAIVKDGCRAAGIALSRWAMASASWISQATRSGSGASETQVIETTQK
jgi:hypothetical protein